jgi:hypothetical protein
MRLGFRSKVLLVSVIAVVAIGCIMMFHSFTQKQAPKDGNLLTTLLEAPLFISPAEAAQTTTAFPEDEAGISAYVKVSAVDIEKIKAILSEAEQVGDNYIVGITQIPNFGGDIGVHLYADTDGWLVAYIGADDQAAKIMQWGEANQQDPQISVIQSTTLEDALRKAGDTIGTIVASKDIKYYDFEAPEATGMALFIRTCTGEGSNIVQVELPASYMLYDASYYCYAYSRGSISELKVDGTLVASLTAGKAGGYGYYGFAREFNSYKGAITTGILHKIEISLGGDYSAGVATVVIYKAQ